jgi:DNA-binding CsgD family transcriptional regulator
VALENRKMVRTKNNTVRKLVNLASDIRAASSLDVATDSVLSAGHLINMPSAGLVDNVLLERRQPRIESAFGLPTPLTEWWHSKRIVRIHRDIRHGLRQCMPFKSTLLDEGDSQITDDDRSLREKYHQFGIFSLLAVPVHLPDGGTAFLSWQSTVPGAAGARIAEDAYPGLQVIAYAFVDALERNHLMEMSTKGRKAALSARERDCVRLVADGCTIKEVARSLSLSPFTVRDYLGNAMRRLDARNLPQLVTVAWRRGEIGFE